MKLAWEKGTLKMQPLWWNLSIYFENRKLERKNNYDCKESERGRAEACSCDERAVAVNR